MNSSGKICVSMVLCWLTSLAMAVALYMVFIHAPEEKTMGAVQRIFYFHVSSAWIAFLAFFIVMIASIAYLRTQLVKWDILAHASAEIGTLFCSLVLLTGPLWAKPVWNVWWTWDMRLTTTLVLWLMYVGYLMLRRHVEGARGAKYAAVFGIVAFLDVPFVFFSIRWWRGMHPGHLVAPKSGGLEPAMLVTLLICLGTFLLLYLFLLQLRVELALLELEIEKIYRSIDGHHVKRGMLVENENYVIEEYNVDYEMERKR